MGKSMYGYSPQKIKTKAEKRGITEEGYLYYLMLKRKFRGSSKKPEQV